MPATMKRLIRFVLRHVPRRYIQRVVHLCTPVLGLAYAGRGVECPVCGAHYRRFMPYGYVNPRGNALCPRCLALERHRLMWLYLKNETAFFETPARLLHVAPERCFLKRFEKLPALDYVTADLESPLAKVKMDIQRIPFPDGEFDVIFCNHILEHVDDDRRAMREMYRVMRPGRMGHHALAGQHGARDDLRGPGRSPTPRSGSGHFGQKDHLRDYGRDYGRASLRGRLRRRGDRLRAQSVARGGQVVRVAQRDRLCRPQTFRTGRAGIEFSPLAVTGVYDEALFRVLS